MFGFEIVELGDEFLVSLVETLVLVDQLGELVAECGDVVGVGDGGVVSVCV